MIGVSWMARFGEIVINKIADEGDDLLVFPPQVILGIRLSIFKVGYDIPRGLDLTIKGDEEKFAAGG